MLVVVAVVVIFVLVFFVSSEDSIPFQLDNAESESLVSNLRDIFHSPSILTEHIERLGLFPPLVHYLLVSIVTTPCVKPALFGNGWQIK